MRSHKFGTSLCRRLMIKQRVINVQDYVKDAPCIAYIFWYFKKYNQLFVYIFLGLILRIVILVDLAVVMWLQLVLWDWLILEEYL